MQRRKLGMAVVWMVCLLGMVAVVWSRPPLGSSRESSHPPLALAAQEAQNSVPQVSELEPQPAALNTEPLDSMPTPQPVAAECGALPARLWVREIGLFKISLKFAGNRILAGIQCRNDKENNVEYRMAADYHLTKDSMLYGIITSAEILSLAKDPEERMEAEALARLFFDQPFAVRFRLDEETLTIKDFKLGQIGDDGNAAKDLAAFAIGCYRPDPSPKPSR